MTRRKRLVSLMLGALSVLAVATPPAQAQGTMGAISCVTSFRNVIIFPFQTAGTGGVDDILGDTSDDGGPLDTDDGDFAFNGGVACAGADAAGPAIVGPGPYNISASGTYQNLLCGTGTANGTATLTGDVDDTSIDFVFNITFAAGVGELSLTVTGGTADLGATTETIQGGGGRGVISIVPSPEDGGNCVTTDVTQFFVNGGFEATLSG
jgi:hypothetical protein